jgi:hypothetical protein
MVKLKTRLPTRHFLYVPLRISGGYAPAGCQGVIGKVGIIIP